MGKVIRFKERLYGNGINKVIIGDKVYLEDSNGNGMEIKEGDIICYASLNRSQRYCELDCVITNVCKNDPLRIILDDIVSLSLKNTCFICKV